MKSLILALFLGLDIGSTVYADDALRFGEPLQTVTVSNVFIEMTPNASGSVFLRSQPIVCWWRGDSSRVLVVRFSDVYECKLDCVDQNGRPVQKTAVGKKLGMYFEKADASPSKMLTQNSQYVMHPVAQDRVASFKLPSPDDLFELTPTNRYTLKVQFQCVRRDNWTNWTLLKFPPVTLKLADELKLEK